MNLLLLGPEELRPDGTARLSGRRLVHAREVLRLTRGGTMRVGVLGGATGVAEVLRLDERELVILASLTEAPPARPGIDLLLALPRPKALRRILPSAASLGVDRIVLVNAARVEKSYFESAVLAPEATRELLILGLEQARDTRLPDVLVRKRFRPFVEDELDELWPRTVRLVAHPSAQGPPSRGTERTVVGIGPEGGWVPFEIELLREHGFTPFTLGPRPLRVEVALPYALGMLKAR
ncbi:MAG TPA: 16S rRNA (uracil(1498)-N(3))-methyltransferase [Myxococcales bacterium]|nr:16S rRNA (uracil(1498)-N(3))-methyltransferase [Myxococcales bacterium]